VPSFYHEVFDNSTFTEFVESVREDGGLQEQEKDLTWGDIGQSIVGIIMIAAVLGFVWWWKTS
jgi:uncharacterized membrane protein